ncbi:hypothetical protein A4G20_10685 [Pasteurellaceae bacterium RH1A]|nr:hypothetical protein A4G20_10685 [Pasteurellaceae bacterium RH1A]
MILVAKETSSSITKNKKYICLGIYVYIDRKETFALIRRNSDLTPVLEKFEHFSLYDMASFSEWNIKSLCGNLRISIEPLELADFDWDLYYDGNEKIVAIFESIYKNMEDKYGLKR